VIEKLIETFNRRVPGTRTRSILMHTLFWMVWLSRTLFDIQELWGWNWSLIYIVIVFCCQAPLVYLHLYVLVPKLLNKKQYIIYLLATILGIVVYSFTFYSVLKWLPSERIPTNMTRFLSRISPNFDILEGFIVIVLTYALKYTLIAFITQNELLRLQKEKLELELNALKSQIHPHFLFNTLNNLYSLTLKNSEKASEVVLKLSDIMRYVLYQANENEVLLTKEIAFVKNYVDLQKIRYNQKYTINFEVEGKIGEQLIAPLLFIDFIENAFKHGLEKRFNDGFVDIKFIYNNNQINLKVVNSKGQSDQESDMLSIEQSGIGLTNVKKRLSLIYKDKHHMEINDKEKEFIINLTIDLSS